ncbi:unnamed protein product [Arctogadus glacialis]
MGKRTYIFVKGQTQHCRASQDDRRVTSKTRERWSREEPQPVAVETVIFMCWLHCSAQRLRYEVRGG